VTDSTIRAAEPLATALPDDVEQPELRAWLEGRTALDAASRLRWAEDRVARLRVLAAHHQEQLEGALQELDDLGELALQEADAPPVERLHDRIQAGERDAAQADAFLAMAEQRLDGLRVTKP
jgi:hypothetical protein